MINNNIKKLFSNSYIIWSNNNILLDVFYLSKKEKFNNLLNKIKRHFYNKTIPLDIREKINKLIFSYNLVFYNDRWIIKWDIDFLRKDLIIKNIYYHISFVDNNMNYSLIKHLEDRIIFDKDQENLNIINKQLEIITLSNIRKLFNSLLDELEQEYKKIKNTTYIKQYNKNDLLLIKIKNKYCFWILYNKKIIIFDLFLKNQKIEVMKFIYINNYIYNINSPFLGDKIQYKIKTISKDIIIDILKNNLNLSNDILNIIKPNLKTIYKKDIFMSDFFKTIKKESNKK